jgi:hypothetical protein
LADPVAERGDDERYGQGEVEMRTEFSAPRLDHQTPHGGHGDGRGHDGEEGKSARARERRKLKERDIPVQGDAERIPAEPGEDVASEKFQRHPGGGGQRGGGEVAPGTEPDRPERIRILPRGGDYPDDSGPHGGVEREIEAKDEPTGDGEHRQPVERAEEKDKPGEVAEFDFAQEGIPRVLGPEPDGGDQRREGDPDEPALVERREAEREQDTAQGGSQPGPEAAEDLHRRSWEPSGRTEAEHGEIGVSA